MPYVNVWVDDECHGNCEHVSELKKQLSDVLALLRSGEAGLAEMTLGKICGDRVSIRAAEREAELAALFSQWRNEKSEMPWFDWAHAKRKTL
jgi:hypothetical protein